MKKALLLFVAAFGIQKMHAQVYQTVVDVQDSISTNTHWTGDHQYMLHGYVYVTAGATLTIDSGVVIKGDKNTKGTLIVERGAKIYANGTKNHPVVFTSAQPIGQRTYGDWGGLVLCGNAPTNWTAGQAQVEGGPRSFYGGTDPHDNSGKLTYVRIEFPGIALSPNNEVNGLTLCGVGDATQIDHVQVTWSGDDGFEFFGGTVNAKYVISHRTWDDDFDTDAGYRGKVQFGAVVRAPYAADISGSKAFESDAYGTGTYTGLTYDSMQVTRPVFSNMTMVGPMVSPTSTAYDPNFVSAIQIRRGSSLSLLNSVVVGWPAGILIDESSSAFGSTTQNIASGSLQIRNNIIAGTPTNMTPSMKDIVYVINGARSLTPTTANADTITGNPFAPFAGPWTFLKNADFGNKIYATQSNGVNLQDPFNLTNPNLVPLTSSPISSGTRVFNSVTRTFNPNLPINYDTTGNGVNYNVPTVPPNFGDSSKASDPFFTPTNFVGAFAGTLTTNDNWMAGWANFDPVNTSYPLLPIQTDVATIQDALETISVYPNPTSRDFASLSVNMYNAADLTIRLVDVTGKLVKVLATDSKVMGKKVYTLDLSNVQNGMYLVNITSGNYTKSVKLSVIK